MEKSYGALPLYVGAFNVYDMLGPISVIPK